MYSLELDFRQLYSSNFPLALHTLWPRLCVRSISGTSDFVVVVFSVLPKDP